MDRLTDSLGLLACRSCENDKCFIRCGRIGDAIRSLRHHEDEAERREEGCDHCNNGPGIDNCLHANEYTHCDCCTFSGYGDSYAELCNDYEREYYCRYCGRKLVE